MGATAETAVSAHGALTGIVTAVDGATAKVDTLHQSWQQNQATIGDVVPTADWTQPLNDQAHTVMGQTDAAIAEHATQLAPPPRYVAGVSRETLVPLSAPNSGSPGIGTRAVPQQTSGTSTSVSSVASTPVLTSSRAPGAGSATSLANGAVDPATTQVSKSGTLDRVVIGAATNAQNTGPARRGSAHGNTVQNGQLAGSEDITDIVASDRVPGTQGSLLPGNSHNSSNAGRDEEVASADRSRFGKPGRGPVDVESMVNRSVETDAAVSLSAGPAPGPSPVIAESSETIPYMGMLTAGTSAPVGGAARGQYGHGVLEWALPIGNRPIIEPGSEIAVRHDPGPGVIGIDL
jgi:hypothetical protein